MPDREKVIRWLEACSTGCEYGCPYEYEGMVVRYECKADLMRDALELLKRQEPRIIAFDELESDNLEVVWFEAKQSTYIGPMLTRGIDFNDSADWFKYGRDWRCWTQRPTDEQREATPWNV